LWQPELIRSIIRRNEFSSWQNESPDADGWDLWSWRSEARFVYDPVLTSFEPGLVCMVCTHKQFDWFADSEPDIRGGHEPQTQPFAEIGIRAIREICVSFLQPCVVFGGTGDGGQQFLVAQAAPQRGEAIPAH
jgi:hypothetical protein